VKRALAITPVKFGISFNLTAFNQAGALVHVYKDGSVLINHGGTEMGQGPAHQDAPGRRHHARRTAAQVRLAPTRTDKVPNTSATAASSGADLNGGAVKNACEQIRSRLEQVAAGGSGHAADVRFVDGVTRAGPSRRRLTWEELVPTAYFQRVQLFAAGYYRTEGLHWDSSVMQGSPFKYFAYGAPPPRSRWTASPAPTARAGRHRPRRRRQPLAADRPRPDRGRLRAGRRLAHPGGPALGRGDGPHRGRLSTQAASTYKLPSFSEMPADFTVTLLERATRTAPSTAPRRSASRR
jgi:xanthine dehydrogenase large subunit